MKLILYLLLIIYTAFLVQSCSKLDNPAASIPASSIISMTSFEEDSTVKVYSILADSSSYLFIKAVLGERTTPSQSIVFTTSEGFLTLPGQSVSHGQKSITVSAAYRDALIVLYGGKTSHNRVLVSASVSDYSDVLNIEFKKAYPEEISINPGFINADPGDTLNVNVETLRSSGVVSEGIVYHVQNLTSDSISLNLPGYTTLTNQKGKFNIVNPSGKSGTAKIKITVPVSETDSIYEIVEINYL